MKTNYSKRVKIAKENFSNAVLPEDIKKGIRSVKDCSTKFKECKESIMMEDEGLTINQLKGLLRNPFAFPGGYEVLFIANDAEFICWKCVKENFRIVLDSMMHEINDGWRVIGYELECNLDMTENEPIICAHCHKNFAE